MSNLNSSIVVERIKSYGILDDNEEYKDKDTKGRTDIQCWEIDETGLDWKLLYTKENIDKYPILFMINLNDGKIVTGSNVVKIYQ